MMKKTPIIIRIIYLIYQVECHWDMNPTPSALRSVHVHDVENPARLSPPPRKQSKRISKQPSPTRQHQPYRDPLIGLCEYFTV